MSLMDKEIAKLPLHGTENGMIEIVTLKEPYGEGSSPVLSIGVFMNRDSMDPDWKIHLPKENIDSVIEALRKAKEEL